MGGVWIIVENNWFAIVQQVFNLNVYIKSYIVPN